MGVDRTIGRSRNNRYNLKIRKVMKEFWKSWIFWAIVAVVILAATGTILYFTVPAFKSMVLEIAAGLIIVLIGWLIGHFVK